MDSNTPPPVPPPLPSTPPVPPPVPPPLPSYNPGPPPESPRRTNPALFIVLLASVAAGIGGFLWKSEKEPKAKFKNETAEERQAGIRAAFQGTGTPVSLTSPEAKEIDVFFQRMLEAYKAKDGGRFLALFDFATMMEVAADQNPSPELKAAARAVRRNPEQMAAGAGSGMKQMVDNADHVSYTLRRLEIAPSGKQAVAWVEWRDPDATQTKERLWLIKDNGWKAYDYEELDMCIRMSTSAAAAASMPAVTSRFARNAMQDFQALAQAVGNLDAEEARKLLPTVRKSAVNKLLGDVIDVMEANLLMMEGRHDDSLTLLEKLAKRRPDMPIAHYLQATAHSQKKNPEAAIKSAERYLEFLGDDADMLNIIAASQRELKQPEKARASALRVLELIPHNTEAIANFASVSTESDAAKLEELLRKAEDADALLWQIQAVTDPDSAAFAVVTAAAQKAAPKAESTLEFAAQQRCRTVWKEAAGADAEAKLTAAFKDGSEENFESLADALRDYRYDAKDRAGLLSLAAAATEARPGSTAPIHFRTDARALELLDQMKDGADEALLRKAIGEFELPGGLAWRLFAAFRDRDQAPAMRTVAAILKELKPEDPMNEVIAGQLGDEPAAEPEKKEE